MDLMINGISKNFGKINALQDVNLRIQPGMFGLLGPNGAGKTTLMRIVTTLLSATSGSIQYGDAAWDQPAKVRSLIGYLPQKFSLYKQTKVQEVLDHVAVLKGLGKGRKEAVERVLESVNLLEHRNKKIGQLSGGMVRRLGIAQAILNNPPILVVDEPTVGLDPEERIRFRKLLRLLGQESIVIISTHIVEDIEATCDQAAILYKGKLLANGDIGYLREQAQGKVWDVTVSHEDYYRLSESWDVISSYRLGDDYVVRILSEEAPSGAQTVKPSLEDAYLYLMKGVV